MSIVPVKMQVARDRRKDPMELYCSLILSVCVTCTGLGRAEESGTYSLEEATVGYYPCDMTTLTRTNRGGRQCPDGQFDWAVAS